MMQLYQSNSTFQNNKGGETISIEKKVLNTPIQADILDNFKSTCNEYNLKMNTVLEALLSDFSSGNYDIVISRTDGVKVVKK